MTRILAPAASTTSIVRSPLVPFAGAARTVPLSSASRPSVASPRSRPASRSGAGRLPLPVDRKPVLVGRSSSWPYGSASAPRTTTVVPRLGDVIPSGIRTAMPPVPSAIAISGGVPRRPPSAVTTPATLTTVPIGTPRASTMLSVPGGVGTGVGVGFAVGAGVGVGPGVRVGVGLAVGAAVGAVVAVGAGVAVGVAPGVGFGVGAVVAIRRGRGVRCRGRGGRRRHDDAEVALLGDMDSIAGQAGAAAVPLPDRTDRDDRRAARDGDAAQRERPDDDSHLARAVVDHESEAVREVRRRPDGHALNDDAAAFDRLIDVAGLQEQRLRPLLLAERDDVGDSDAERSLGEPVVDRASDHDERVRGQSHADCDIEVHRDPAGLVLDEGLAPGFERSEVGGQHADDLGCGAVRLATRRCDRDGQVRRRGGCARRRRRGGRHRGWSRGRCRDRRGLRRRRRRRNWRR